MNSLHGTRIRWFLAGLAASVFVLPLLTIVVAHTIEQGLVVVTQPTNVRFLDVRPRYGLITVNIGSFARPSHVCIPPEEGVESLERARSLRQAVEFAESGWDPGAGSVIQD